MRLTVDYDRSDDTVVIVRLSGEIDMSVEEHLTVMLQEALAGQPPAVVVDLAGLRFLDCAGVRVLVRMHATARAEGCALTVRHPQPIVEQVLRILGVADLLGLPCRP